MKEGFFRLLRNEHVDPDAILEGGFDGTISSCAVDTDVLVLEDTTTLNYWHLMDEEIGELGGIEGKQSRGFMVHTALAVERASGVVVGLFDQHLWTRKKNRPGRKTHKKRPYEEKEIFKWQRSSEQIKTRMPSTSSLVWVCDREADVHEYLAYKIEHQDRFVVRAAQNRAVDSDEGYLWEQLGASPVRLHRTVGIQQRGRQRGIKPKASRPARTAELEVRATPVTLTPRSSKRRTPIELNAVHLAEPAAPEGVEPLEWMLLTSEPIDTKKQIELVVEAYEKRWLIEEYHKVLKTGCRAEERRFQTVDNLRRALAVLVFVAVRMLQLRTAFEQNSKASCEELLPKAYWQCLWASVEGKKKIPKKPPNAAWAARSLAKLAGWIQTKKGMPPGYLTMWKGWARLEARAEGWLLAMELNSAG